MTRIAQKNAGNRPLAERLKIGWAGLGLALGLGFATSAFAQIVFIQPPPNDAFTNATIIRGSEGSISGNSMYATFDFASGEPFHGPNASGQSVWYRWTASSNSVVAFDTGDSWRVFGFDSVLAVYTGTNVGALTLITNNANALGRDAAVSFSAFAGTNYYLAVDGAFSGYFYLNWTTPSLLELTNYPAPPPAPGAFQFGSYAYAAQEDDPGYALIVVQYNGGAPNEVSVNYTTSDGSAVAGQDYFSVSGSLVFSPGQTIKTFSIPILDNPEVNVSNRTINLQLFNPSPGNSLGLVSNSIVLILDDEFVPSVSEAGEFSFSSAEYYASERERSHAGGRSVPGSLVTVTRTGGSKGRVLVDYYTTNRPYVIDTNLVITNFFGFREALPGSDYSPVSGTLVFDNYQMSTNFMVPVFSDGTMNGTAEVLLVLSNPRPAPEEDPVDIVPTLSPFDSVAALYVVPVWPTSPYDPGSCNSSFGYFSFERLHYRVNERGGSISVTVLYPPCGPAFVGLRLGGRTDAGSSTASAGSDFSPVNQILEFGANQMRYTVTIDITNDTLVEFNEDILLELYKLPAQPPVNQLAAHANVTILYDEQPPGALDREWNPDTVEYTDPQFNLVPGANFQVRAVAVQTDGKTVLGGDFTHFNSKLRPYVTRIMPDGSLDTTFNPPPGGTGPNGFVQAIALYGANGPNPGKMIIAGGFTSYNNQLRKSIARLTPDGLLDPTFHPGNGADGPIRFLSLRTDGKIFIGGDFLFYDDVFCNGVALVNPDGSVDPAFNPALSLNGSIWIVVAQDPTDPGSRVYIGGDFTSINGQFRSGIARLNADGSLDSTFNPGGGADGVVFTLAVQSDGKLLIGGAFTQVDFRSRNGIARLQPDGALDTSFDPGAGADDAVYAMVVAPDDRVFIGGIFTSYNETRRVGLARLKTDGTLDTTFLDTAYNQYAGLIRTFSFEPPRFINSLALQADGNLMIGGSFTNIGGNPSINAPEPNNYTEFTRADKRTRYNIARLIGSWGTNDLGNPNPAQGPGNAQFGLPEYTVDENGVRLPLAFRRIDGALGSIGAYMTATNRTAIAPEDFEVTTNRPVVWGSGYTGPVYVNLIINDDDQLEGDETVSMKLDKPFGSINLGGEYVPLGGALGIRAANLTIGDNDFLPGVFTFSQVNFATNENARYAFITVIRTNGAHGQASVDVFTRNGSARVNQDYLSNQVTLTFASEQTSRLFLVELLDDTTVEYDETVILTLTNAVNALLPGGLPISSLSATLTIVDDDFPAGRLNFSAASYNSREDEGVVKITVTRTGGSVGTLWVSYDTINGTATAGQDYTYVSNRLYWGNGDASERAFEIPLNPDGLVEGTETVGLRLFDPLLPGSLGGLTDATFYLADADAYGSLAFSQPLYLADENGTNLLITVVRSEGSGGTVSVDYTTVGDAPESSAVEGVDYLATRGTLTLQAGELARTFPIQVLDDEVGDGDRNLSLMLYNPTNAGLGALSQAVVQIVDNESFHVPAGSLDTSFNQDAQANEPVYALLLQADGKLVVGGSFTAVNNISRKRLARLTENGQLDPTFNSGEGPDAPIRALMLQADGKLLMGGLFGSFNGVNRNRIARLGIDGSLDISFDPGAGADNPVFAIAVQPDMKILIGGSFSKFNGLSRPAVARLNANGTLDASFVTGAGANGIVYAIVLQPDGKIVIGGDFTEVDGWPLSRIARLNRNGSVDLTFNPGTGMEAPVRAIAIQPDGKILAGGSFTQVDGIARNYLVRLNGDGSVDLDYLAGLSGADNAVYALALQLDGKLLVAGDFTRFNEVTRNRLTRLQTDGSTDPAINFGTGANAFVAAMVVQPDRKVVIGGGFTEYNDQPRQHLARLHGGSLAGSGQLEFARPQYTFSESGSNVLVTVRRIGGTTGEVAVNYAPIDGTAINGRDYFLAPGALNFPQGETMRTIDITLTNTPIQDGNRIFILSLDGYSGGAGQGTQPITFVQILDDESAVEFSNANYSVNENDVSGHATISVLRGGATNTTAAVKVVTVPVTATEDADYLRTESTVVFAPGEIRKFVEIQVFDDRLQEGNEILRLVLSDPSPSNSVSIGAGREAILTIVDDDFGPGMLAFESSIYTVDETEGNAVISVIRTQGLAGVVSVRCRTLIDPLITGQASPNIDYVPRDLVLAFADGDERKTFTIPIINDAEPDAGEIIRLRLSEPTGGAALGLTNASLTIVDDEFTPGIIVFSTNQYWYSESANAVPITVRRTRGTTGRVSVDLTVLEATAAWGRDFVGTNVTLDFADGDLAKTIFLPIIGNTLPNEIKSFHLALSNPMNGAALGNPALATVFLSDDDVFPGAVDIGFNSASGANGPVYTLSLTPDLQLMAGGGFTTLNGIEINRLAKLTTNAIVDLLSFNPAGGANSNVFEVAYGPANEVYVAGEFLAVDDLARTRIARLLPDGTMDVAFDPGMGPNDTVYAAAAMQLPIYSLGGSSASGAVNHTNLFDIQASNATLTVNFLGATNETNTLLIYAIVDTNTVTLLDIALTNASTTISALLEPSPSPQLVFVVNDGASNTNTWSYTATARTGLPNEHQLLIGGRFTSVAGTNRNFVARLNWDGSLDTGFAQAGIGLNGPVYALTPLLNGQVLVAGDFTNASSLQVGRVARLNRDGSVDPAFNPGVGADAAIRALAVQEDGRILIGGAFTNVAGAPRRGIARLLANGQLDVTFDSGSGAYDVVHDINIQADGTILVVGAFTEFNGQPFNRIVRLNPDGSLDATFDPGNGANDSIYTVTSRSMPRSVNFSRVGLGESEPDFFTIDTGSSEGVIAFAFNFLFGQNSLRIYHEGLLIYDTGYTNGIGAVALPYGPGLSTSLTFVVNEFGGQPGAVWIYAAMVTSTIAFDTWIAVGGDFTLFDGLPRNRIAVLNGLGALDPAFDPGSATNTVVNAMVLHNNPAQRALFGRLIVGGDFTAIAGVSANRVGRLLTNGVFDTSFDVGLGANGSVRAVALQTNNQVIIGGLFNQVDGTNRYHLARLNEDGSLDPFYNSGEGFDNDVYAVALQADGKAVVGGKFSRVGLNTRNFIARMTVNGSPDLSFNPGLGANDAVQAIAIQPDQKILIGGDFTEVDGKPRPYIARLNPDGSMDTTFNPPNGPNGRVLAIAVDASGGVLIGGAFTQVNGTSRGGLARLSSTGALDPAFAAGLAGGDDYVSSILVQADGRMLVGGSFTKFHGMGRNRLARLNADGTIDPTINFGTGADNFITSIALPYGEGAIIVGGGFTAFNGLPRTAIARLVGGDNQNAGDFQFTVADFRVPENSHNAMITVVRQAGLSGAKSVRFTTANGSAQAGTDYQTVIQWLEFAPGEIFKNVTVPIIDNLVTNVDRALWLTLDNPTNSIILGNPNPATLTLLDNESVLGFSAPTFVANESGLSARITVTRQGGTIERVSVQYASTSGTATPFLDYADVLGTVVLNPGITAQSFNVPLFDDFIFEGDETVRLTLFGAVGPVELGITNATLVIVEDDVSPGTISFADTRYSAFENQGQVMITVIRTNGYSGTVSARYETGIGGNATPNADYLPASGVIIFGEGETNKTFTIQLLDDPQSEGTETIRLNLSNPNGGASLGLSTSIVSVFDDDGPGTFVFTNTVYQASEGDGVARVEIQRLGGSLGTAGVTFQTSGGTAVPGLRYQSVSNHVVFTNGVTSRIVTIPLITNSTVQDIETIGLLLSQPSGGATIGTPGQAVLEISDDDISLTFSSASYSAIESSGQALVRIVRFGLTNAPVSVTLQSTDGSAQVGDADYVGVTTKISFAAGETNKEFAVRILNDTLPELNEAFNLTLVNPANDSTMAVATVVLGPDIAVAVTIVDDDVSISFESAVYSVGETNTNMTIAVTRYGGTDFAAFVNYETRDNTALATTNFFFPGDYLPSSGQLDFLPGQTSNSFIVTVLDDFLVEGDETLHLILSDPSTNAVIGGQATALLRIVDNERSVAFASTNYVVNEQASNAVVTLVRRGAPNGQVSVVCRTVNGTALAGVDYLPVSNRVTWADLDMADKTVLIPILPDAILEGTETVQLVLTNQVNSQINPLFGVAELKIVDDAGTLAFSQSTYRLHEGSDEPITLYRTGGSNGPVRVDYFAGGGSATGGLDYTNASGTLAFGDGESRKDILLTIREDDLVEGIESFVIQLLNPQGGALIGSPARADMLIIDNEVAEVVAAGAALEAESVPNGFIDPNEDVTVQFAFRNIGSTDTTNLVATLFATNGVVFTDNSTQKSQDYGVVVAGGTAVSRPFSFRAVGTNGATVSAVFSLREGSIPLGADSFTFTLGRISVGISDSTPIQIKDNTNAVPYPAIIHVTSVAGMVSNITVTLHGLQHAYPSDIDMVLMSPNGQTVLLMSDSGIGNPVNNATLTFDQKATSYLKQRSPIVSGTYYPTNYDVPFDTFPDGPLPPYGTSLNVFHGINPNGEWKLYIVDDTAIDEGVLSGGWSLSINSSGTFAPSADVSVAMNGSPDPVSLGGDLTYTVAVTNHGPGIAEDVWLTNTLPAGLTLVSSNTSLGTLSGGGGRIIVRLGNLSVGTSAFLTTVATAPSEAVTLVNQAWVAASTQDFIIENNSVTLETDVVTGLTYLTSGEQIEIMWPVAASDFELEVTTDLREPVQWIPLPGTYQRSVTGGMHKVTIPMGGQTNAFYRLRKQ